MLDSTAQKWQFWILWVLASAAAGAAVALVARAAAYSAGYFVGGAEGTVAGEAALGVVALGGFMGVIAIAQWLVMLRLVPWSGRWVLANAAGGALGGAVMLSLFAALTPIMGETVAAFTGVPVGLAAFGLTLWLALRRRVAWAGRLALAGVVGLIAAGPLGAGAIGALFGGELGAGAGFGGIYGAVTGGALLIFGKAAASPPVSQASTI